jgi:hypothetical protein
MSQQTFFDFDTPIAIDTRAAAAASIQHLKATHLARVLDFLDSRGAYGAIDEEIAAGTHLRESTARARRCELRDSEHVCDSGHKRKTRSGRLSIVWTSTGIPLGS